MMSLQELHNRYARWLYRGGKPSTLNKWAYQKPMNWLGRLGLVNSLVTLEVVGRKSGMISEFPLVMLRQDDKCYLVSMLGTKANWVRNVQADNGRAVLREGRRRHRVYLSQVPIDPEVCAPLLKAYLEIAPGARPHLPIAWDAPVDDFKPLVNDYPIFEVVRR